MKSLNHCFKNCYYAIKKRLFNSLTVLINFLSSNMSASNNWIGGRKFAFKCLQPCVCDAQDLLHKTKQQFSFLSQCWWNVCNCMLSHDLDWTMTQNFEKLPICWKTADWFDWQKSTRYWYEGNFKNSFMDSCNIYKLDDVMRHFILSCIL